MGAEAQAPGGSVLRQILTVQGAQVMLVIVSDMAHLQCQGIRLLLLTWPDPKSQSPDSFEEPLGSDKEFAVTCSVLACSLPLHSCPYLQFSATQLQGQKNQLFV